MYFAIGFIVVVFMLHVFGKVSVLLNTVCTIGIKIFW